MRWENERRSENVEDRRRSGGQNSLGGLPIPMNGKAGVVLFIVVMIAGYYGVDLSPLLEGQMPTQTNAQSANISPEEERMANFTSTSLGMTEDLWQREFKKLGKTYQEPTLVIYSGQTSTACGYGQAAMGPFYCPADYKVYIDLSFYDDMRKSLGGGGDFAQGYVVAHEVGHHVQNLLGINQQVRQLQQRASKKEANQLSVKMELQADCFAGIWGKYVQERGLLEMGDLDKAMKTAEAIGDDRLQKQSGGAVVPDSFTHGTSAQRQAWFERGFKTGDLNACNTFQ
ncbi:KPN_02809 family neutral zinc metallopeptidase [Wohlfahrtiimonas chitiniclastica]|uniref:KPN_02809 family neutral zinc metallopeptidase n=1 Tax=Wohlfahrtiimonas chitiniclastica TaxID=400946 RepID=UPI00037E32E8|nr:neutral zinc metallopeptidase [Wohlfahrtiimonas chitiniclastica]